MKNYIKNALVFLFMLMIMFESNAETITIRRKLSTSKAASFWGQPKHGFKFNNIVGKQFTVSMKVETVANIQFGWINHCLFSPINFRTHNDKLVMYATQATELSPSDGSGYKHDYQFDSQYADGNPYYYYRSIFVAEQKCRSNSVKPDNREFFKNQALTTRWTLPPFNWLDNEVDVDITITFTGDLDLMDFNEIKVPGVDPIYWYDLIDKTGYNANHACATNPSSAICQNYEDIRSITDLNATDVKIQAHRGIWGKINQENTIGAMEAAKSAGYKLLESDIMPYGVSNFNNPSGADFAVPSGLACFHDFTLERYSNGTGFIIDKNYNDLKDLYLNEPRSNQLGTEQLLFFDAPAGIGRSLIEYAINDAKLAILVDMKNLESFKTDPNCEQFCEFQTQERKDISLFENLKFAIEYFDANYANSLEYLAIKTYKTYDQLKKGLVTDRGVNQVLFDQVLWAPILADKSNNMDPAFVKAYLDGWFLHNESVLYYETNFFKDGAPMLDNNYCIEGKGCYNVMEYIYKMSGRRAGIFSEEPVGGKGTVDRWGRWTIKKPSNDRRGDHLWLLSQPFFKHAVITTDRPDIWKELND